jgi:16S rRNA (cytosine1402-N4)-methyltransferase
MAYHNSVLLSESIEALAIRPDGIYVDATFGGGGHARAILEQLGEGRLIAFDQDEDALSNQIDDPRFTLIENNFRFLRNFLRLHNAMLVDGILADLGISGHQIDIPERGFSTRFDGALDMRMDRRKRLTASDIVNNYSFEELAALLHKYGEIPNAGRLAGQITEARQVAPITTTTQLKKIADQCAPRGKEFKYEAQVFQALRIEVNQEMASLEEFLKQATEALKPGGRLVIISYHSLEDKMVKNWLKTGNLEGILHKDFYGNQLVPFKLISGKAIIPSDEEIMSNNRARSARLRVAEKLEQ